MEFSHDKTSTTTANPSHQVQLPNVINSEPPALLSVTEPQPDKWIDVGIHYRELDMNMTAVNHEPFIQAASLLFSKAKLRGQRKKSIHNLSHLLVELARLQMEHPNFYLGVRFDNNAWRLSRYNPNKVTRRTVQAIRALNKAGYLELRSGFRFKFKDKDGRGYISRIRPTEELIKVMKEYELLTSEFQRHVKTAYIHLKDSNKKLIPYPDCPTVSEMTKVMRRYNSLLQSTKIEIQEDGKTVPIEKLQRHAYRVFNNSSFEQGGRITGPYWQNCPSAIRSSILINSEKTVELDYEGQHISMLYAMSGGKYDAESQGDPYAISEVDSQHRKIVKGAILCCLNAKSRHSAWMGLLNSLPYNSDGYKQVQTFKKFDAIIKAFILKHPLLEDQLHSSISLNLMNQDSLICEAIIGSLTERGIPVLTIHDSFIVAARHETILREAMTTAYANCNMEGALPRIVCKNSPVITG